MAKQITTEKVRTEIARLIRLCRWGARSHYCEPEDIRRQEESIWTLQDLCDALGFTVPTVNDPDLGLRMVKGVYRRRRPTPVRSCGISSLRKSGSTALSGTSIGGRETG